MLNTEVPEWLRNVGEPFHLPRPLTGNEGNVTVAGFERRANWTGVSFDHLRLDAFHSDDYDWEEFGLG